VFNAFVSIPFWPHAVTVVLIIKQMGNEVTARRSDIAVILPQIWLYCKARCGMFGSTISTCNVLDGYSAHRFHKLLSALENNNKF
jgi:hypothetical protein